MSVSVYPVWHWIYHCYWTDYRNIHIGNWSSVNITILESRGAQIVQKYRNQIKIVGDRRVTQSKSHTKDLQLLGNTKQNLSHHSDLAPRIRAPRLCVDKVFPSKSMPMQCWHCLTLPTFALSSCVLPCFSYF